MKKQLSEITTFLFCLLLFSSLSQAQTHLKPPTPDNLYKTHLKEYKLNGHPKSVKQRVYYKINESLASSPSNLKLGGSPTHLGLDIFDLILNKKGNLTSSVYYKFMNGTIVKDQVSNYYYNKKSRLIKETSQYFNDEPHSNDDDYFTPPENNFRTTIYSYEKFDFPNDTIDKKRPLRVSRSHLEISSKTFNSKQVLLHSNIKKYRIRRILGVETNSYTTFYDCEDNTTSTYRHFSIHDRRNRLRYFEMHYNESETAPHLTIYYHYRNPGDLKAYKSIRLYKGRTMEIKSFEHDENKNMVKEYKTDLNGNLKLIKEFEYKYDVHNNWIEKIEHDKKKDHLVIIKRTIKYH